MAHSSHLIELILSEFGSQRQNAGGKPLIGVSRLDPALNTFKSVFPEAVVTLYTDADWPSEGGVTVRKVEPPFDRDHPRYGWRAHDYFQAKGLLDSRADVAIALDADFEIVSEEFRVIAVLADIFGLCLPINPRLLLRIDGGIGVDSTYDRDADPTLGLGMSYNLTPIAFRTTHPHARELLESYCQKMVSSPGRGAVHLALATYELGFQPHVLAPQWCVSSPRDLDSRHMWNEPVALHVGHADVAPRLERERRRSAILQRLRRVLGR